METKNIRNICLIGHGNSGKTSLAESMLYVTGAIDRMGKVSDGNTVCDYDAESLPQSPRSISAAARSMCSTAPATLTSSATCSARSARSRPA